MLVRPSSGLLMRLETESQCVLDCPPSCRASKFSEHLVTQTSLLPLGSSVERSPYSSGAHPSGAGRPVRVGSAPSQCSWSGNYEVRVVRPAPTEAFLPWGTTKGCGDACARFSGCPWTRKPSPETLLPCPWRWAGLGLQSAVRSRQSAYWPSWACTLPLVRMRHRTIAESFVEALERQVWVQFPWWKQRIAVGI